MIKLKKKLTNKIVFLKMKNGKIITVKNKKKKLNKNTEDDNSKDNLIDNEYNIKNIDDNIDNNVENNIEEKINKKSFIMKIFLCILLVIIAIIFMKNLTNIKKKVNFNINKNNTIESNNNLNTSSKENEKEEEDILSKIEPLIVDSNTQLIDYYTQLKSKIEDYTSYKIFRYEYDKFLKEFRIETFNTYSNFLTTESSFGDKNDIFLKIRDRYANLVNTVDSLSNSFSKETMIDIFNEGLETDKRLVSEIVSKK